MSPRLPCLYTALDPRGAVAEFEKHQAEFATHAERDLVSLDVEVQQVLDLTDVEACRRMGIDPLALIGDSPSDLAACRDTALRSTSNGGSAIFAPSAALPGAVNLMIYLDSTQGIVSISNGPDRVRIRTGFTWSPP